MLYNQQQAFISAVRNNTYTCVMHIYLFSKVFAYLFVHDSVKSSLSAGKSAIIYENEYICAYNTQISNLATLDQKSKMVGMPTGSGLKGLKQPL